MSIYGDCEVFNVVHFFNKIIKKIPHSKNLLLQDLKHKKHKFAKESINAKVSITT